MKLDRQFADRDRCNPGIGYVERIAQEQAPGQPGQRYPLKLATVQCSEHKYKVLLEHIEQQLVRQRC